MGLTRIHVLEYDLTGVPLEEYEVHKSAGRVPFYTASFSLKMRIAPGILRVQLLMGERLVAAANINDQLLDGLVTLPLR